MQRLVKWCLLLKFLMVDNCEAGKHLVIMFAVNDDEEMLKKSTDRPTDRLNVIFALQLALFITFPFYCRCA